MNDKVINRIECEVGESIIVENGNIRSNRSSHRLLFPEVMDGDFAYLSGYHLGDGYLEDINKTFLSRGKAGYDIVYADKDVEQIKTINNIFNKKFRFNLRIYKRPNADVWIGRANSCKVLHWFLHEKLDLPMGRKNKIHIPVWILGNKEFLANFMSGFFDAEGDVSNTSNHSYKIIRIQLTQKNKDILLQLKDLLFTIFDIKSNISKKWNQDCWMLHIWGRKNALRFRNNINFRNTIKKQRLGTYLEEKIEIDPQINETRKQKSNSTVS